MKQLALTDSLTLTRFYAKIHVNEETGCWEWTGSQCGPIRPTGRYGQIWVRDRKVRVHRFAYELFVGPIPDGLTIDHLCHNTLCANPVHLEPVSIRENLQRGHGSHAAGDENHCQLWHLLDEKNTYIEPSRPTTRRCRECRRIKNRKWWRSNRSLGALRLREKSAAG